MRVFLDDVRTPPDGWVLVKTVPEVQELLKAGGVTELSLDHDLGEDQQTGYDLCKWMAEHNIWPSEAVYVHSANPVGAENMRATIARYFNTET